MRLKKRDFVLHLHKSLKAKCNRLNHWLLQLGSTYFIIFYIKICQLYITSSVYQYFLRKHKLVYKLFLSAVTVIGFDLKEFPSINNALFLRSVGLGR